MFKPIILAVVLIVMAQFSFGQQIVNLNQAETGNQNHPACVMVHLQPGYSYTPVGTESMHAYIATLCGGGFIKLKEALDGGYYYAYNNYISFQYNEEYEVGLARKLAYNIYDQNHNLVGGVDLLGNTLVSGSGLLNNTIGENKFELNVAPLSLNANQYYTLEVFNDKNEKEVLKFKLYN